MESAKGENTLALAYAQILKAERARKLLASGQAPKEPKVKAEKVPKEPKVKAEKVPKEPKVKGPKKKHQEAPIKVGTDGLKLSINIDRELKLYVNGMPNYLERFCEVNRIKMIVSQFTVVLMQNGKLVRRLPINRAVVKA